MERAVGEVRARDAASWALSHGRSGLTGRELSQILDVPEDQVRRRLHAPTVRGEWVMPVRGLWVPVPPEYRTWGAPPGIELIDAMMRHLGAGYYIGWLTAAGLHGAAHHAPQVFQVGVDQQVRDRTVGRTRFSFARREVDVIPTLTRPTRSGTAIVSSVAATALDVVNDITRSGGVDNAATVVLDLAELEGFDVADIVTIAPRFPAAASRRIGWLLDRFGGRDDLGPLQAVACRAASSPSRLDPGNSASGPVDSEWMLYLNRDIEPDT